MIKEPAYLKVDQLKKYLKYLEQPIKGNKAVLCENLKKNLVIRKLQFYFFKKKGEVCPICLGNLHAPLVCINHGRFHNECLILYINATGNKIEPICKTPISRSLLQTMKNKCLFLHEPFLCINLEKIYEDQKQTEIERSLVEAISGTISEFESNRTISSIKEIQIFLQFLFSINTSYATYMVKNLIEIKKEDVDFKNFLTSILHRFEVNLNASVEELEKTKKQYKSIYVNLQQQSFIPPSFFESNIFEDLILNLNRTRQRRTWTRSMAVEREGAPRSADRSRRANHVFNFLLH